MGENHQMQMRATSLHHHQPIIFVTLMAQCHVAVLRKCTRDVVGPFCRSNLDDGEGEKACEEAACNACVRPSRIVNGVEGCVLDFEVFPKYLKMTSFSTTLYEVDVVAVTTQNHSALRCWWDFAAPAK